MRRVDVVQLKVDIALCGCIQDPEAIRLTLNRHRWECRTVDCHHIHECLWNRTWVRYTRHHWRLARSSVVWVWNRSKLAWEGWPEPLSPVVAPHAICTRDVIWVLVWHVYVWVPEVTHRSPVPCWVSCCHLYRVRYECLIRNYKWDTVAVFIIRCW